MDRFAEFVVLLDKLLTTDGVDFKGEYFETRNGRTLPGCVQQPRVPFIMAANGPRSLRLATQYGAGWVTTGAKSPDFDTWFASVRDLSHRLDDVLEGRPFDRYLALDSARYSLSSADAFEDVVGRAADLGFTDVITHWPRADGVYAGSEDVLEKVGDRGHSSLALARTQAGMTYQKTANQTQDDATMMIATVRDRTTSRASRTPPAIAMTRKTRPAIAIRPAIGSIRSRSFCR